MNKSIIDRLLYKYQKYDLTWLRIDYETIEKIASEFSILQQKVNQLETSIATKDSELLQLKEELSQLKTNRDEAIEYIKHSWWLRTDQTYDTSKDLQGWEVEKLLSILERGKE